MHRVKICHESRVGVEVDGFFRDYDWDLIVCNDLAILYASLAVALWPCSGSEGREREIEGEREREREMGLIEI
jgi:hypothetical protein